MASHDEVDRFIELLKQLQPCPSFEPHFNAFRDLLISYGFTSEVSLTDYANFETMFEETDFKAFIVGLGKLGFVFKVVLKATTKEYSHLSSSSSSSGSGSASGSDEKKISANKKNSTYTPWEKLKAALKFLRPEGLEDGDTWRIKRADVIFPNDENCPAELQNEVNGYAVGKVISNVRLQGTFRDKHDDMRKMGLNLDVEPRLGSRVTPSSSNGDQRKRPRISSSSLSDNDTEEEWASSPSSDDDAEEEWDSNSGVGMSKSTRSRIGGLPYKTPKRIFEPLSLVSGVGMSKSTRSRTGGLPYKTPKRIFKPHSLVSGVGMSKSTRSRTGRLPYKTPKFGKIFDAISNGDINVFKSLSSELTCFRINLSEDCRIGCPTQGMKSVEVARYYGQSEMEKYLFE
jgi:hypothetical protein